jgi:branched-chain amino acid transport system substrate-binding protein
MKYILHLKTLIFIFFITFLCISCKKTSEIRIGATFPLTGDNALYGDHLRKGIELAKLEANSKGGINGQKIDVIYSDDANDPKNSVSNLEKFININKVIAVIGSAGSNCTYAMAPIANKGKTVIISPTSSQPELSEAGLFVYRTCPSDVFQEYIISDWLLSFGYKRIGMLYVTNSWGVAMKNAFEEIFSKKGGVVLINLGVEEKVTDFKTQLLKISQQNVDAIFMPTYARQGGRAIKQAKELNIKIPFFGADPWDVGEFVAAGGDAVDGCMYTVFSQYKGKEYQVFYKDYKSKYNEEPDFLSSSGFDVFNVIYSGIKYLYDHKIEITPENLKTALDKMPPYIGATGDNTFDENGDVIKKIFEKRKYNKRKSMPFL